jgi:carbamoyltransferase
MLLGCEGHEGIRGTGVSPYLGPAFESEAIKKTLDGCKLSYSFVGEGEAIDRAVDALAQGQLVGWFQDRMEWGPRALGHRSILANPRSPYVLENLNGFLRKRERWRSFGVSVCQDNLEKFFCGPPTSPFMEYEYSLRDDGLRPAIPSGATSIRVQTIPESLEPFWTLHKRMGQATGSSVLVNTSLNGFHEPIACTPRDAIRVFYGSGLDMLVLGRFILEK